MPSSLSLQPPTSFTTFLLTDSLTMRGDLHKWQKEIQLTPCLCLLRRHWAHLSPLNKYLHVKEEGTLLQWGAAPQAGRMCEVSVVHWSLTGNSCFCPAPLLHIILMRFLADCCRGPPPLHLSLIARRGSNSWTACFTALVLFMEMELTTVHCLCK